MVHQPQRRLRVALVGNAGGHLDELRQIAPAFDGHEVFYVTQRYPWTVGMDRTAFVPPFPSKRYNALTMAWYMVVLTVRFAGLWLRRRPQCVVSTGAELAVPAFWIAKLMGARTIYVECLTRVYTPSVAARLILPVADRFFSQQEPMTEWRPQRVRFAGCVL